MFQSGIFAWPVRRRCLSCPTGWSVWGKYLSQALNSSGSVSGTMHAMADRSAILLRREACTSNHIDVDPA
jgi:hypothetical protein